VGTTVALILAPVVVAAFGIAFIGLIEALTGWSPELIKRLTPDDSVYISTGFTKVRVVMITVGLGVGYITAILIRWALRLSAPARSAPVEESFDGTEPQPAQAPAPTQARHDDASSPSPPRPQARPLAREQGQSVAQPASHRST
jgi:hypothetical protein